jgi:hypothetical protein
LTATQKINPRDRVSAAVMTIANPHRAVARVFERLGEAVAGQRLSPARHHYLSVGRIEAKHRGEFNDTA